jgi:hypothetical protein
MRMRTPLRVNVTRHEEKEQKLQEFLLQHVAAQHHCDASRRSTHLLVVARSLESPVVRAIASLGHEIAAAGLAARIILAHIDRDALLDEWGRGVAFMHEIRWARHPRLIEAHEQLVIDTETCWIGDCMRRDPTKCDAYESFVEGCGEAAGCAAVSFERLWTTCQPLLSRAVGRGVDAMGPGPMPPTDGTSQATVGTRH